MTQPQRLHPAPAESKPDSRRPTRTRVALTSAAVGMAVGIIANTALVAGEPALYIATAWPHSLFGVLLAVVGVSTLVIVGYLTGRSFAVWLRNH